MRFRKSFRRKNFRPSGGGSITRKKINVLGIRIPMLLLAAVAAVMFIPALKTKVLSIIKKK